MNKEFLDLYKKWYYSYIYDSTGKGMINDKLIELEIWCKKNKNEALECIKEVLLDEPSNIIILLPGLTNIKPKWMDKPEIGLHMSLDECCNWWLNYLLKTKNVNYYKDWKAWKKYLNKEYMNWRPNIENDPNITLNEFKEGKRNSESRRSYHNFSISQLKDEELQNLYIVGHLGNMTPHIIELKRFYNIVEEEIKRRKICKK